MHIHTPEDLVWQESPRDPQLQRHPAEIPAAFFYCYFVDVDKLRRKFRWRCKGPRIALKERNRRTRAPRLRVSLRGRGDKTAQGWQQGRRVDWKGHPSREIRDPNIATLHPQTPETQHEAANPNPPAPDGGSEVAVETSPQRRLGLGSGRGQRCWSWRGRGACRPVAVEPASLWQQSSRGTDTSPVDADPGPAVRRQRVARSHTQSGRRPGGRAVPSPGRKVESTFFSSSCNGLCQQTGEKPPGARAAAGKGLNQVQQPPTARGPSRVEAERAPAPGRALRTARGRRPLLGKGLPVSPLTPRPRPGHPAPLSPHSALPPF